MEEVEENAKVNCRAVFVSSGGTLTEKKFLRDYRDVVLEPFPTATLGRSLKSLLESWGGFRFSRNSLGETVIHCLTDEKTAHISALIAGQKKPKSRSKGKKSSAYRPRLPPRLSQLRQPSWYSQPYQSNSRPSQPSQQQYQSYSRPSQPPAKIPPLMSTPVKRKAEAPKPRYSPPPIVPQRQPLTPVSQVNRTVPTPIVPQRQPLTPVSQVNGTSPTPIVPQRQPLTPVSQVNGTLPTRTSSVQQRLTRSNGGVSTIDKQAAESKILAVKPVDESSRSDSTNEDSCPLEVQPVDDAQYVDIQWLQGKVYANANKKKAPESRVPSGASIQPSKPVIIKPVEHIKTSNESRLNGKTLPEDTSLKSVEVDTPSTVTFKSHVDELEKLTAKLSIQKPEFKFIERRPLKSRPLFTAKVKIGAEIFSSFPFESSTKEEAMEFVAKNAVERISEKYLASACEEPPEPLNETVMVERVYQILEQKVNGMFDHAVAEVYRTTYNANLPQAWLTIIEQSSAFSVDRLVAGRNIIYPVQKELLREEIDINANTIKPDIGTKVLPSLEVPEGDTWDVYVTSVSNDALWLRFIGEEYDVKYNDIMTNLEMNMMQSGGKLVEEPQKDHYYTVYLDNCLIRVQLLEFCEEGVEILLIDTGEVDVVQVDQLRHLENWDLPPQAIKCSLAYVDLSYEEAQTYVLNEVIGGTFVADVVQQPSSDTLAKVMLYNTSLDVQKNMNSCILEEITKNMHEPCLPQKGQIAFLKIVNVEKETPPYFQLQGTNLSYLNSILNDLEKQDLVKIHGVNAHPRIAHLDGQDKHMFIAHSAAKPNAWRRGIIVGAQDTTPLIHFVDHGYTECVAMCNILDVEKVLPPLANFPKQAIQVNLSQIPPEKLNAGIIARLKDLAPSDEFLMGKLVEKDGMSGVDLFKRIMPDNIIVCLNTDLLFYYEEYSINSEEIVPIKELSLRPYQSPPLNSDFDVFVTLSSNPFNFIVQPVKDQTEFNCLMKSIQEYYKDEQQQSKTPEVEDLTVGSPFAAKHPEDSQWYRVSVVAPLAGNMVSVRYCDYGDVGLVARNQLRPLESKFMEMPSLGIKARLHGIKPKHTDWTVDDCVRFNKIVTNKAFVSKVSKIEEDTSELNGWRVCLKLIDTSGSSDINVAELMVKEGVADFV